MGTLGIITYKIQSLRLREAAVKIRRKGWKYEKVEICRGSNIVRSQFWQSEHLYRHGCPRVLNVHCAAPTADNEFHSDALHTSLTARAHCATINLNALQPMRNVPRFSLGPLRLENIECMKFILFFFMYLDDLQYLIS